MTTARLGIDIVAFNRANAAFAQTQRGLQALNRTASAMKQAFGAIGIAAGIDRFSRAIIGVVAQTEPVKQALDQMNQGAENFARRVGEGGLAQGMIDFAESVKKVTSNGGDLDDTLGKFMGGSARLLGQFLERLAPMLETTAREARAVGSAVEYMWGSLQQIQYLPQLAAIKAGFDGISNAVSGLPQALPVWMTQRPAPGKGDLPVWMTPGGDFIGPMPADGKGDRQYPKKKQSARKPPVTEFQRLSESWTAALETPMDAFVRKQKELDQLMARRVITDAKYRAGMQMITTEYVNAAGAALPFYEAVEEGRDVLGESLAAIGDSLASSFNSAIDGLIGKTMTLSEAFRSMAVDVLRSLSQMWTNQAFQMLFGGGYGGSNGGILGNLFGSLFGSRYAGLYARGGTIPAGKWGIAGEGGVPEVIGGPASVFPVEKIASMLGRDGKQKAPTTMFSPDKFAAILGQAARPKGPAIPVAIMGNLFGSLFGSRYAGLYARGGTIPAGKWGIAGEGGVPEVIGGPASVFPVEKIASMLGRDGKQKAPTTMFSPDKFAAILGQAARPKGPAIPVAIMAPSRSSPVVQIVDQRRNAPAIEQRRGADGSTRFIIRDAVRETLGRGDQDKALYSRTGGRPVPVRRG